MHQLLECLSYDNYLGDSELDGVKVTDLLVLSGASMHDIWDLFTVLVVTLGDQDAKAAFVQDPGAESTAIAVVTERADPSVLACSLTPEINNHGAE